MKEFIKQKLNEELGGEKRVKFDLPIPDDIRQIKDVFKKNGYKLYVIGGAVRDSLLDKPIKDYDLATDALPEKVESMMKAAGLKVLGTGEAFGVMNVFTDSDEYEIATFRSDGSYKDGRRPDSVEYTDIQGDVNRRDLTINAMFYDIDTFEIVDFVGGMEDLKNGIIRTVGQAEDRFSEDRLRILRAIRFAGRFGSELDTAVDAALQKDASLEGISGERIRDEFIKGIKSAKSVKHFLGLIDKYDLFDWIFTGLNVNKRFIEEEDPTIVLATLLKDNNLETLGKTLNKLKYSSDEVKGVSFLIALSKLTPENAVTLKKLQRNSGISTEQISKFANIAGIDLKLIDAFINFELTVSGPEVMDKFNLKPGPEVGQKIHNIETSNFNQLIK